MTEALWVLLQRTIVSRYDSIMGRLVRVLGSRELAEDVLHETYLRFQRTDNAGIVAQPESYIFRVALNIATDRRREDRRRASRAEELASIRLEGGPPDLAREMEARSEIELLKKAMAELSPRRRAILIAARVDGLSHDAIAERLNISRTMVQKDLRRAVAYCTDRLQKNRGEG